MMNQRLVLFMCLVFCFFQIFAQDVSNRISQEVELKFIESQVVEEVNVLSLSKFQNLSQSKVNQEVSDATLFNLDARELKNLYQSSFDLIEMNIPLKNNSILDLQLYKTQFFSQDFSVYAASDRSVKFPYQAGIYYWGIVKGDENSIVAVSIAENELMGVITLGEETYNLGKLRDGKATDYILFKESDIKVPSNLSCGVDDVEHYIGNKMEESPTKDANNCVRMYIEVDYDIYLGKGGVQQAADYVNNVFNQVAILYANEAINFVVNELVVWDTPDPYTGPNTSSYLNQFRDYLGGNYNGDLAHLVGYTGNGGIAYVDVLCFNYYGVGYSDINSTYNNVPSYSWTIEVLTHEIGHNLGSQHTHACAWNGNNTALDGCGPAAGYSEGCNAAVPQSGTIMSYCHLVSGVGINFTNGFGQQPGDRIRGEVYNAGCLTACAVQSSDDAGIVSIVSPSGSICVNSIIPQVVIQNYGNVNLTSAIIEYQLDAGSVQSVGWTGNLTPGSTQNVSLPSISFSNGSHTFSANTSNPNGVSDGNAANNGTSSNFSRPNDITYYADNDGDGYGNPSSFVQACAQPGGYVLNNADCNDNNSSQFPGASCNDGNVCTIGDVLDSNCNCSGTYIDADEDGVCIGLDPNDGDACVPNPNHENCLPCNDLTIDGFESGFGNWNDGGSDCALVNVYANSGNYSIQIRDNSGTASSLISDSYDLAGIAEVNISFSYYPVSMENGEDFFLEVSTNGGGSYSLYKEWNSNAEFFNNVRYNESVPVTGVDFTANTVFRFRCDASGNADAIYLDDIVVEACSGGGGGCTVGADCDDNDACTTNDVLDSNCDCAGTFQDEDGDSVCDAQDQCPGQNDNIIGSTCNDGNICTTGDKYNSVCECVGSYTDNDGDGFCIGEDDNDNDPCIPNSNGPGCGACDQILSDGFESGLGNWNDGGGDCTRVTLFPNSGSYSIRIRDNTGASSSMYTDVLNLSAYDEIVVDFSYYPESMENGEDFFLEYSTNNGADFTIYQTWASGTDFTNNVREFETVSISGVNFTNQTIIRFRCDASANGDRIYIDDVVIEGCGTAPLVANGFDSQEESESRSGIKELNAYPIPTNDQLFLDLSDIQGLSANVQIFALDGRIIMEKAIDEEHADIVLLSLSELPQGVVYVRVQNSKIDFKRKAIVISH